MSNPFDDPPVSVSVSVSAPPRRQNINLASRKSHSVKREDPIWEARHIEWPLPSTLPSQSYPQDTNTTTSSNANTTASDKANLNAGYLGGLVGKFIGQTPNEKESMDFQSNMNAHGQHGHSHGHGASRALKAPRSRCTVASNGWVVSLVESGNASSPNHVRLLSRWNVRRNTHQCLLVPNTSSAGDGDKSKSNSTGAASSSQSHSHSATHSSSVALKRGRIAHVFLDPTGCHCLLSGTNGDLFYSHSSSKAVWKLKGFGLNADGTGNFIPGKPWRDISASLPRSGSSADFSVLPSNKDSGVQLGLTPGCYITSVGWNSMGSERATKTILLGSSFGEIYEYEIVSDLEDEKSKLGSGLTSGSYDNDNCLPSLMVRLNESESGTGTGTGSGVVSGLHFSMDEGNASSSTSTGAGVAVLAATSGVNKQTRLHSYLSVGGDKDQSTSTITSATENLRRAFSSDENVSRKSFMELPGQINWADLKVCNGSFAMRTETGIYYGTIDNSNSRNVPWNKRGNGIIDAGMLTYETASIPISIAITPHHFITLLDTNEVRFINRVAKKTIQKDRVDWVSMAHPPGATRSGLDDGLFNGVGQLIMDVRRPDQVWLRKSRSLVHMSSTREDRDVWKFSLLSCLKGTASNSFAAPHVSMRRSVGDDKYMDAEFAHTKSLCTNNAQKAVVTAARAEFHLSHGRVELAAKYMAQCPPSLVPFAETALRLALPPLGIKDTVQRPKGESSAAKEALEGGNIGLISYLTDKLRSAKSRNDGVACTMIGAWLVELYLHEREHNGSNIQLDGGELHARNKDGNNAIMQQFLNNNTYNMDAKTILRILCSHDVAASECSAYAASSGDIGTAINAALCNADYMNGAMEALCVLAEAPIEPAEPFYYKHAFALLCRAPMASAKGFLGRFRDGLSATRLLPTFMRYEQKRSDLIKSNTDDTHSGSKTIGDIKISESRISSGTVEMRIDNKTTKSQSFVDDRKASIVYFEGVVSFGCKSTAVYNYLVSLYVDMDDEIPLYQFLSKNISSTATVPGLKPRQKCPLDLPYTLRVVLQSGRHYRSVIKLYMGLGMRQRAVELAIKVDPGLAKELTRDSIEREEKKRLWLMIAKYAAEEEGQSNSETVVSKVISVLKECGPDVLSIEDVLPFLPDVAQIDQFKEEICEALTSYSSKIENYLKEMNDCDQTCNGLREEIRRLRDFTTEMNADAKCVFSEKPVVAEKEPFYVFPSGFVALESALKKELLPYLNEKQRSNMEEIEHKIQGIINNPRNTAVTNEGFQSGTDDLYKIEELQCELDGLIAAECPLTGSVMISSIDRRFCDSAEDELYISCENDSLFAEA